MARLGDVATYINGFAFKPTDWSDEGKPIIRIQDLTGNSYQANRFNGVCPDKYNVYDGDILISWSASLGVYVWHGEDAVLNQHIFKVVFDKVDVDRSFFIHQVKNILANAADEAHGATMKHLTKPVFDALPFALPPLEEQKRIAAELDKATHLISLRKQQIAKLDELVKARFVEMFGEYPADSIRLKDCCVDVRGGGTPSMQHPEYYGGNVPFIKSGDVRGDSVSSGALWLSEKALAETTAKYVPKGSVLVVNRSAALLREFRAAIATQPVVINQDIKAFIPKQEFTSEYLLWAIKIQTRYLLTKVTTVLTSHIDLADLLELRIAPVSLERQQQFTSFVAQINQQKLTIQHSLDKLELLKKALMQKYFR